MRALNLITGAQNATARGRAREREKAKGLQTMGDVLELAQRRSALYLIERAHHLRPDKWEVKGEFVAGAPWRDGRLVSDETMREEVAGYRKTWFPDFRARVRCPNGKILSDTE